MIFDVGKEMLAILINLIIFFQNLLITNMSLHRSGAQKRKEKNERGDNGRGGLQTLFHVGMKKKKMI